MKKIYLEFEEGTSIQEIKEEMMYYQSRNQPVVTTIKGEEVHSDAHNIEDIFERLTLGLTEEEYNQYKEQQYTLKKIKEAESGASKIESLPYFRYYFGLSSRLVKKEKRLEYQRYVAHQLHFNNDFITYLIIATQIMLALEDDEPYVMYNKITDILDSLKRDSANLLDIQATLSTVFNIVETYGQKGEYLQRVFFSDSTLALQRALSTEKAETESQIKNLTFPKGK